MTDEAIPEDRAKYVAEKIDFYLKEIHDFCGRHDFSRVETHYWHIVANAVTVIQGGLSRFRSKGDLEKLSHAEETIRKLETYFNLLERFPDYLRGETQSGGASGNSAFPDIKNLKHTTDYIDRSKQRLEPENETQR